MHSRLGQFLCLNFALTVWACDLSFSHKPSSHASCHFFIDSYTKAVDTSGLVLEVRVHAASLQDRDGAKIVSRVSKLRQGRGHRGIELEIVAKSAEGNFVFLPKRWIVERTFAWLGRSRRLREDYEALCETIEAMIMIAMVYLMTKRLARP